MLFLKTIFVFAFLASDVYSPSFVLNNSLTRIVILISKHHCCFLQFFL